MRILLFCFSLFLVGQTAAQTPAGIKNLDRAVMLRVGYGPFASAGDLGDRFGSGFAIDGGIDFMPGGSAWQFGVMAQYGFGNEVKEDVLAGLRTEEGFIIGNQRQPAQLALRQRQLFVGPRAGYTIRLGTNRRAGIQLTTGLGYFFSRIRFQQDPIQFVPQVEKSRQAGYDRLAGGPAIYQFVGYQQLALSRRLNFYIGGELMAGFTRQLRNFDIPLGSPPPSDRRTDILLGLKAGLIVPIYGGEGKDIFY